MPDNVDINGPLMCINKPCSVNVCIIKHQNLSVKCPFFTFDNVNLWFVNAIDPFVNAKKSNLTDNDGMRA